MILEARQRNALHEVLIIAAALSVQDVRDRPMDMQAQADQQHAKFDDEKSEFSGYVKLWNWIEEARGGHGKEHKLSNRQFEQLLRQNFINVRRLREWRDIHTQLHTVVAEHKWKLNDRPASYEELHKTMLSGLLGNIGWKLEEEDGYLGARGIKFFPHPGAHLKKRPGRWIVCAELVETTRLFGRGIANIEPAWIEEVAAHLLKRQLLDPHWEKKAAEVVSMERATLYGLVVYSGRRVPFARADMHGAREIFLREGLVAAQWETKLPFLAANRKLVKQVEELEHKSRRQDVLVDEELIFAFYDQQVPQEVYSGTTFERWYREASRGKPGLLKLSRDELMRHEAAGITTEAFPRVVKLGGVDCSATYLHEPGDPRDGVTVAVPLFVLNQVSEDRAEWLVPGMLKDKIQALLKSLPQKPRSRFVPLPESAARLARELSDDDHWAAGSLTDALLKKVRDATSLDVKRTDFKLDMVPAHLFMNVRVVDEHGRQLGMGRNLGALKAELGAKARGAFQALAGLKAGRSGDEAAQPARSLSGSDASQSPHTPHTPHTPHASHPSRSAPSKVPGTARPRASAEAPPPPEERYTSWTFGELPELMEVRKGGTSLIGFPALIDKGDAVAIEVFDEPEAAAAKHRLGLGRLFALQLREALKYLERNIPDLQKMAVAYMPLGTMEELRAQVIDVALDRAFLMDPLPANEADFRRRVEEGRGRLTLIANEVARLATTILADYAVAARRIRDTRNHPDAAADATQQLQRLVPKRFLADTPWARLQHLPRYLKAITLRLDKLRADPARDAARMNEVKPQEQRYWRLVAERKGAVDERMEDFRWLLEELRVSFFAQELKTPQPVSVKRLEKVWAQLNS
jgi:ATP-dependent helicase HrpA